MDLNEKVWDVGLRSSEDVIVRLKNTLVMEKSDEKKLATKEHLRGIPWDRERRMVRGYWYKPGGRAHRVRFRGGGGGTGNVMAKGERVARRRAGSLNADTLKNVENEGERVIFLIGLLHNEARVRERGSSSAHGRRSARESEGKLAETTAWLSQ